MEVNNNYNIINSSTIDVCYNIKLCIRKIFSIKKKKKKNRLEFFYFFSFYSILIETQKKTYYNYYSLVSERFYFCVLETISTRSLHVRLGFSIFPVISSNVIQNNQTKNYENILVCKIVGIFVSENRCNFFFFLRI